MEAEQEAGQVAEGSKALAGLTSPPTVGETNATEAPFAETHVASLGRNAIGAPAEGETEAVERALAKRVR